MSAFSLIAILLCLAMRVTIPLLYGAGVAEVEFEKKFIVYSAFRQKAVDEYQFINHRLSWMIFSEAAILAIWGVIAAPDRLKVISNGFASSFLLALSAGGAFIAFLTWRSVQAAQNEVEYLKSEYGKHYPECASDPKIPNLTGLDTHHKDGHIVPNYLPWGMFFLQCILMIYAFGSLFAATK